jgi:hypothetical protein
VKEKILAALKTKYKNLGFDDKTLEQVTDLLGQYVTTDEGIEPAINGAESTLKTFQSLIDKRVTDAIAKAKADNQKSDDSKKQDNHKADDSQKQEDEKIPAWAQGIIAKLDGYEKQAKQSTFVSTVKAKLAEKKVPESYWKGRTLAIEKEEDIETVVKQIETDYTTFRQDLVNEGVIISTPPDPDGGKAQSAIAKQIAENRNNPGASTEGVTGKKLI